MESLIQERHAFINKGTNPLVIAILAFHLTQQQPEIAHFIDLFLAFNSPIPGKRNQTIQRLRNWGEFLEFLCFLVGFLDLTPSKACTDIMRFLCYAAVLVRCSAFPEDN